MYVRPTRLRRVAAVASSAVLLTALFPLAGVAEDAQAPDPCEDAAPDAVRDLPATKPQRANCGTRARAPERKVPRVATGRCGSRSAPCSRVTLLVVDDADPVLSSIDRAASGRSLPRR